MKFAGLAELLPVRAPLLRLFRLLLPWLSRTGLLNSEKVDRLYQTLRPRQITLTRVNGHRMYVDPSDFVIGKSILLYSGYEREEKVLFERLVAPGMVIAEVGANIGDYTLVAAQRTGPSGYVYAFEPAPNNYCLLVKNVRVNGYQNVECINAALSSAGGTQTLFLDAYNYGNPSLARQNVLALAGQVSVPTDTLDHFMARQERPRIDVLKMDTQGAEGLILAGAEGVLCNKGIILFLEYWPYGLRNCGTDPNDLLTWLASLGFEVRLARGGALQAISRREIWTLCGGEEGRGYCDLVFRRANGATQAQVH
jgi:FkbM family methyltransferase